MNIKMEIKKLPEKNGVYIMKNESDQIIYIGKAKNIKKRVSSYFRNNSGHNKKTIELVHNVKSFEYIITDTEVEALVLECNLIKKHFPKYNIALKDNKGYPYIKITKEEYPKVFVTKNYIKNNDLYFGPYVNTYAVQNIIDIIESLWMPRKCNKVLPRDIGKTRECLNFHINKCTAPCNNKINKENYTNNIKSIIAFLKGDNKAIINTLEKTMKKLSSELKFEEAIEIRNKIHSIKKISVSQKLEKDNNNNMDVIGLSKINNKAMVQIFHIRKGRMLGRDKITFDNTLNLEKKYILENFIKQYYSDLTYVPSEIIVGENIDDILILEWLHLVRGEKVNVTIPKIGEKLKLLNMANKNAQMYLEQFGDRFLKEERRTIGAIREIQKTLELATELKRIEAYDISNIQGIESVGSMIVFENGTPKRSDYRKFKIKTVIGPDDYKSIYEVISRRFMRYQNEKELCKNKSSFNKLPDLLLVDGGKGQVSSAKKALKELNLNIEVGGMIKDDKHRTKGIIYNNKNYILKKSSEGFKILTRIQDEVHRFAIEYHRKLRTKTITQSKLDEIKGVGEKRRNNLLKHFKDIESIKMASIDELIKVDSINKSIATEIYFYFNNDLSK